MTRCLTLALFALVALPACAPEGTIKLDDDTATPTGDDTGNTGDTGAADDTGDTEDTEDTEPAPEPDFSVWEGSRELTYGDCRETLYEDGYALEADWEYYDYTFDLCPECDYVYYIDVSPGEVCGLNVTTETYRIVDFDGDEATIYYFGNNGSLEELAVGDFDGFNITYDYRLDGGIDLDGEVNYPEL